MKIALYNVTTGFQLGGIETYCIETAKALIGLGHEVTLVAGKLDQTPALDGLHTEFFAFTRRDKFWDLGNRFRKLMERLSFARHAFPHLQRSGYDAIVITKPYDFPLAWLLKRRGYHGTILFHTGGTDFFAGDRRFAGAVDHFVACSHYTAKQNESRYERPFQVVYNGVDTEHFKPMPRDPAWRTALNIPADATVVMSVGRLIGWKGLGVIVKAIARLENVHYVYVGRGPYAQEIEAIARELGIAQRAHAAGAQPHAQIAAIMNEADLFVQPSIGEEAFGITLVEAMACGLPVLASAQGGMLEIVEHERDGLLLPADDVDVWHSAIARLAANDEMRERLRTNARAKVRQHFTWHATAARLDAMLRARPVR